MVGLSNDGTGLGIGNGVALASNRLTLNFSGRTLYGKGLTTFGAPTAGSLADVWASTVVSNGGSVSAARMPIIRQFIAAEIASGAWYLTDDYLGFWGENAAQALTSLKQRRLATAVNSPTFTADRGYAFNGTTQYLNTGFISSTDGINCTGTNQRLGVYERTNVSSSGVSAGTIDATVRCLSLNNRRNATLAIGRANTAGVDFTLGTADSRALKVVSRTGGSLTLKMYDRGVKLTDGTAASTATTAPSRAIFIGAVNNIGTATSFRAASIGMVVVGGALSDAQELAQYNAMQAWATSVGAQV